MANESDDRAAKGPTSDLGGRIRRIRTARGLSVRELAGRAGCSPSLLSQVERGVTTPSARVVYAVAHELGTTLDELFGAPAVDAVPAVAAESWGRATGPDGAGIVQRADDRRSIDLSSGVRWERLTAGHDSKVDFLKVVYGPGGQSSDNGQAIRHDGREYLYVLQGEIEAVLGFETVRLREGDSVAFDPATPHRYRNPTADTVQVLSVVVHL